MRKTSAVMAMVVALILSTMGMALGAVNAVTPSTNEENSTKGWAHFNVIDTHVGTVDIEFVSSRDFYSCFEYRSDGEGPALPDNFNPEIEDGLWPFVCVRNNTETLTLSALEYVEIRMVFGAERDERFDWTRVDLIPVPGAQGLQIAKSGPAGERANDNARFKQGNPNASFTQGDENAHATQGNENALENAHENARFKQGNEKARFNR